MMLLCTKVVKRIKHVSTNAVRKSVQKEIVQAFDTEYANFLFNLWIKSNAFITDVSAA